MYFFLNVIILILLCIATDLKAENFEESATQIVSLGGNCHTALALRDLNLRKAAFPFDWVNTTGHINFIKILNEDFYNFFDESCFFTIDGVPSYLNIYYQLDFPHDFSGDNRESEWLSFKKKYARRIERFRALRLYEGKVFFIRALWSELTENDQGQFQENFKRTLEIRDALDQYFPGLDYTLVILSYSDLDIPALEPLEHVVELRIPKGHQSIHDNMIKLLAHRVQKKGTGNIEKPDSCS